MARTPDNCQAAPSNVAVNEISGIPDRYSTFVSCSHCHTNFSFDVNASNPDMATAMALNNARKQCPLNTQQSWPVTSEDFELPS